MEINKEETETEKREKKKACEESEKKKDGTNGKRRNDSERCSGCLCCGKTFEV